ncbi:MAG: peptidase [Chitinophagaceae bacterium]|nr:MAG: peptidase [Chitinophagaceae bacterium]
MVKTLIAANALLLVSAFAIWKGRDNGEPKAAQAPAKVPTHTAADAAAIRSRLRGAASAALPYARRHGLSADVAFLLDMSLHSGRKRFFIYNLRADSVLASGLVAHGSCNEEFLEEAVFSKVVACGCSAVGRYKIGQVYPGRFGTAYKLHGLDSSNRTAFARYIVLHAYDCVPDREIAPEYLCNSRGCPMVSYAFLKTASGYIRQQKKPILLWIYK